MRRRRHRSGNARSRAQVQASQAASSASNLDMNSASTAMRFSTEKRSPKINLPAEGNVSPCGASDLVISRGFLEFGPS
jgi:hypothetical protein